MKQLFGKTTEQILKITVSVLAGGIAVMLETNQWDKLSNGGHSQSGPSWPMTALAFLMGFVGCLAVSQFHKVATAFVEGWIGLCLMVVGAPLWLLLRMTWGLWPERIRRHYSDDFMDFLGDLLKHATRWLVVFWIWVFVVSVVRQSPNPSGNFSPPIGTDFEMAIPLTIVGFLLWRYFKVVRVLTFAGGILITLFVAYGHYLNAHNAGQTVTHDQPPKNSNRDHKLGRH